MGNVVSANYQRLVNVGGMFFRQIENSALSANILTEVEEALGPNPKNSGCTLGGRQESYNQFHSVPSFSQGSQLAAFDTLKNRYWISRASLSRPKESFETASIRNTIAELEEFAQEPSMQGKQIQNMQRPKHTQDDFKEEKLRRSTYEAEVQRKIEGRLSGRQTPLHGAELKTGKEKFMLNQNLKLWPCY